jgi:hypothetical protein
VGSQLHGLSKPSRDELCRGGNPSSRQPGPTGNLACVYLTKLIEMKLLVEVIQQQRVPIGPRSLAQIERRTSFV